MPRWRVAVHSLERTGPPMLARAFVRWLRTHRPDDDVDVVAFRGGDLVADLVAAVDVHVALDPYEPWDHTAPDPTRLGELRQRFAALPAADATLLVSVAAGQALAVLPAGTTGAVVTWAVEQGEDLHWLDLLPELRARTVRWLAGPGGTRADLRGRLGSGLAVEEVPEFVEVPSPAGAALRRRCRVALGAADGELLVVGAGIATHRKAPDLFLETALAVTREPGAPAARFVWFGGERDLLFYRVLDDARRLGFDRFRLFGTVDDLTPWLAAADLFLHPARLDAFPLVCLHAAPAGTPVVAFSGAGGVTEMLGDAFCGAPYPDVRGLAARVVELGDSTARAPLVARQAARVGERYVAPVAAPRILEQLEAAGSVAAGRGAGS